MPARASYSATAKPIASLSAGSCGSATSTSVTPAARRCASAASNASRVSSSRSATRGCARPRRSAPSAAGRGSGLPVITRSASARSPTVSAIGPGVSRLREIGAMPSAG